MKNAIFYRAIYFFFALALLVASFVGEEAHAQTVAPAFGPPAPALTPKDAIWPWEGSDLTSDPSIIYGYLPNGMRYAIRPNKLPLAAVSLQFRVEAGSQFERDDQLGYAHFVEHMVFNGSTNIPEGELTKTMERLGSSFGSDVNARVTFDDALYMLDIPRADGGRLETALKIFRETGDRLLFDEGAVKREMGVVISELNDGDTVFRRVGRRTSAFVRPDDLQTKREPIGQRVLIEAATGAKLREFYETWYRPDRTILVISGDVDVEVTKALIVSLFSDWVAKSAIPPVNPDNGTWPQAELRALIQVEPDLPSAMSVSAVRADETDYGDLETTEWKKWWHLNNIAGDVFRRRLATMQLVDDPPASGISFSSTSTENGWVSSFTISPRELDWERGLRAVSTELRQAMDTGFNRSEIAEAIKERLVGFNLAIAGASTRRTSGLASLAMSGLANKTIVQTPEENKRLFEEAAAIATPETLRAALTWWWRGVEPVIVLLSKAPVAGGEDAIKAAWRSAMSGPVSPRTPYVRAQYTPAHVGAPGRLISTRVRNDVDATIGTFENGVTLAFKATNYSADRVSVSVAYGAGALAFPLAASNWETYARLAWNGDGVANLTRDQMITALAGRSTSLASVSLGQTSAAIGATPRKDDLGEQLHVMLSQAREPRLGPRAATLYRDQLRTGWDSIPLTTQGIFGLYGQTYFYDGLPYFETPTLERALADNDALGKERLRTILENAPINVTIVGDTTWETARDLVAATFGALPPRAGLDAGFAQLASWSTRTTGGQARILRHKGAQTQAITHVSWLTPGMRNTQRGNEFYVLGQVLQLRLTAKVREASGESYSPDGGWTFESLVDKGRLFAHASVTPEHVALVDGMIDTIVRELAANGPSVDEIQRVVDPWLESLARSRQSNGYWGGILSSIGLPTLPGRSTEDPLVLQAGVERQARAITPAKLRRLARRYMVPSNAIQIQVLPSAPEVGCPP